MISVIFRDETAAEEFLDSGMVTANELRNILKKKISMKQLTPQQMEAFKSAEKCQVCEKLFKDTDKRVRDHYHLTGDYRGPAHNNASIH